MDIAEVGHGGGKGTDGEAAVAGALQGGGCDAALGSLFRGSAKGGVGVQNEVGGEVDEGGHNEFAGGIDLGCVAGAGEVFDAAGRADFFDDAVTNQDGSAGDEAEGGHGSTATGATGALQGQQLAGVADEGPFGRGWRGGGAKHAGVLFHGGAKKAGIPPKYRGLTGLIS